MEAPDGFERFALDYGPVLQRLAWMMTGSWQTAEDSSQEALARTWLYWYRIRDDHARTAYARRTLYREVAGVGRLRRSRELPTAGAGEDQSVAPDLSARLDLVAAMRDLPPRQRAVIAFRYLADLSERETAEAMGCAVGTVKSQTSKALAALRHHSALVRSDERRVDAD